MRALALTASVVLFACGGSTTPPPQTPSPDTSSLEASGSSSKDKDDSKESAPASSDAPAPAAAPAASAAPKAAPSDSAPAAAFHPAPSVTGAIDGKAFAPKVAQILAPMKKDGRIQVTLTEATDCPGAGDAKADPAKLTMTVPWQDGYKVDLSALKVTGKKGPGEIGFSPGNKGASATFKPSGTVTVVSAPMEKGGKGKLKIDLQSGDYMLAGDLDIEVCVAPK
jgi:hypothetical protein